MPGLYGLKVGDYIRSEAAYPLKVVRTDEKGVYVERTDEFKGQPQLIAWENLETDGFEKIPEMPKTPESAPAKIDNKTIEEAQAEDIARTEVKMVKSIDDLLGIIVRKRLIDSKNIPTVIKMLNGLKSRAPEEIDSMGKIDALIKAEGDIAVKYIRDKVMELLLTQSMQAKMEEEEKAA